MPPRTNKTGQVLLEFAVASALAVALSAGALSFFIATWERVRCSHIVFERTHERLVSLDSGHLASDRPLGKTGGLLRRILNDGPEVSFRETPETLTGTARCGNSLQRIEFLKLEAAF